MDRNLLIESLSEYQEIKRERMAPIPPSTSRENVLNTPAPMGGKRSSKPPTDASSVKAYINTLRKDQVVITPEFLFEVIPVIRSLVKINPDVGQALHNIVTLGNTGHKVFFDRKVPTEMVDKLRSHLNRKKKAWAPGVAGMNGLVNKMFSQLMIGGALSGEWVVNSNLDGIDSCALVNPEEIRWLRNKSGTRYEPYQFVKYNSPGEKKLGHDRLIKLNTNTYQYYGLNGDSEIPYGFPPYMTALPRLSSQGNMNKNIDFIVDTMGLIGFLETLVQKPDQEEGEHDKDYNARLESLLSTARTRISDGVKDGVLVGFKEDHEFKFQSIAKAYSEVVEMFKNNELQVASGLKQDASLWGRDYSTSETQITVVFIKMLSELKNIQNIVKTMLEFGYELELRLAGYNFEYLTVEFNKSTIQDDLKYQQAQEIKIRNVKDKMIMGIIDQDQAADELDYEAPAFDQPMVDWEILAGGSVTADDAEQDQKREKGKDASDKRVRQKNKPVSKDK